VRLAAGGNLVALEVEFQVLSLLSPVAGGVECKNIALTLVALFVHRGRVGLVDIAVFLSFAVIIFSA